MKKQTLPLLAPEKCENEKLTLPLLALEDAMKTHHSLIRYTSREKAYIKKEGSWSWVVCRRRMNGPTHIKHKCVIFLT